MLDRTIIATENISNLTERILSFRNKHQTDPYLMMNLPTAMAVWDLAQDRTEVSEEENMFGLFVGCKIFIDADLPYGMVNIR